MKITRILAGLVAATSANLAMGAESTDIWFSRYSRGPIVAPSCEENSKPREETPVPCVADLTPCSQTPSQGLGCDLNSPMAFGKKCSGSDGKSSGCTECSGATKCDRGILGYGIIKKSEHCFDDFISPMTNPVYFEDPRQLTEARLIFIDHKIPFILGAPAGRIQLFALQARVRLTENLSFIAVKDGYINSQSPLIQDGWADISAGLKYSLYRDPNAGRLLSAGIRFETTSGTRQTLQANGDGVFDIFMSAGQRLGARSHYMTSSGFILPVNSNAENQMFYWSNHLDRRVAKRGYAFTELNWYNYMKDGNAFPAVEGGDLFNFGAAGVKGNNIVTNAYGLKYKPNRNLETGVAFEFPLTQTRGILDNRLTADLIWRY